MPTRPLAAIAAAIALAGASLAAAAAAPARHAQPVRVQAHGVAADWDAARGSVVLDAAALRGGPPGLRRAVRRGATVTLRIGPATRVVVEDAEGVRHRVDAGELFDELDLAADDVDVEATARVPRGARASRRGVLLRATRLVAHLPPAAEDDTWTDEGDDPGWEDGGAGDEPPDDGGGDADGGDADAGADG